MRKFLTKRNLIVGLIVVAGAGWWWMGRQAAINKAAGETVTADVTRGKVELTLELSGEIKAEQQATLTFPSAGKLAYLAVKTGDRVEQGKLLASLDVGDLQTAETKAWYTYLAYDATAKKIEDDLKGKGASESFSEKSTRVTAQTNRDIAYDAWLAAKRAVKNARLWAPFAGVVTNTTISAAGDTVGTTDGITVVNPANLYFSAEVDETDIGKISGEETVEIELDAFPGEKFTARIGGMDFAATLSSTGATVFPIRLKLPEEAISKMRVGMNGDARIGLAAKDGVLMIPAEAIIDGYVMLAENGKKKVKVETGLEGDTLVEIVSGLNEGDKVIVSR